MKALKRFLIVIIILAAAAFFINSAYKKALGPVNPQAANEQIVLEIPSGAGAQTVAEILLQNHLIQSERAFLVMAKTKGYDRRFIAGRYALSQAQSAEEIAALLTRGAVFSETAWFTIPEGFTVEQIAGRLAEAGLIDSSRFLNLAKNPPAGVTEGFPIEPAALSADISYKLEGYLFPDTYEVEPAAGEEAILRLMLGRLFTLLGDEGLNRAAQMNLSLHEVLTLASIVEREARIDGERALIAGVFYNRLQVGMRLESCATVQYVLGENKEFLTYSDLETPSPYNTYLHAGLPPGPIAAPGLSSVEAALYPEDSPYFFFNYKYDGTGEHYFSETLAEHEENVARAEANLP